MKDTGGPAFPEVQWSNTTGGYTEHVSGMTLRDYFAIHCVFDWDLTCKGAETLIGRSKPDGTAIEEWIKFEAEVEAKLRYRKADAMIAERSKP